MDTELLLICALTGVINLIGALAYAARIAGVRTGRIALSFALFNVLLLVSRTSNGFLGPFLAKRIETALATGDGSTLIWDLRLVYGGRHRNHPAITILRGRKVLVEPAGDVSRIGALVDIDGESPGRIPATFEIVPGALMLRF